MNKYIDNWEIPTSYKARFMEPTEYNVNNLQINDSVKISNKQELFWVYVKDIEDDIIVGIIDNNLEVEKDYKCGDIIFFKKNHFYDILTFKKKRSLKSKNIRIP